MLDRHFTKLGFLVDWFFRREVPCQGTWVPFVRAYPDMYGLRPDVDLAEVSDRCPYQIEHLLENDRDTC